MTESVNTHAFLKTLAALAVFGLLGLLVWPRLDQSESRIVLTGSILAIGLAFYSIFDLQEQRNEKFRHTLDRLVRAAFLTMTLVLVVEIATTPSSAATRPAQASAPAAAHGQAATEPPPTLAIELNDLAKTGPWTQPRLHDVLDKHFAGLRCDVGATITTASGMRVDFRVGGETVGIISPPK